MIRRKRIKIESRLPKRPRGKAFNLGKNPDESISRLPTSRLDFDFIFAGKDVKPDYIGNNKEEARIKIAPRKKPMAGLSGLKIPFFLPSLD